MGIENGRVRDWNEEKGFGFIVPEEGGKDLFFHISDYSYRHKRPKKNLEVQYFPSTDRKGRVCAIEVSPIKGHQNNQIGQKLVSLVVFGLFCSALYFLYALKLIPIQIVGLYGIMSIFAFMAYANDKSAAEEGKWRTPESTLHLLSLLGGWPGAKIAQSFLRHKSKKVSFKATYWITVFINCGALYWLTTAEGSMWLKKIMSMIGGVIKGL